MEDSDHQYSAAFIGSNDDLLTEILIRLPVTSILRFKSVSKHWRLLLSHKHFTHRYDNNNHSNSVGLLGRNLYVPFDVETRSLRPFRSLDFYFNRFNVRIRQSCNGLLLCYTFHNGAFEYYVFNPTTKQLAFIPTESKSRCYMALAFHQTHCVNYKVVCIRFIDDDQLRLIQVQVYSSDTRKWNICVESFSAVRFDFHHPVYWNGSIHWTPFYENPNRKILYFNTNDEQLRMLPLPLDETMFYETRIMYFGESKGHLHLILCRKHEKHRLIVCEMLMDHSGWFVKYRLQLDELSSAFPEMARQYSYNFYVVDVVRGEEEEDTFLVLSTIRKIIRYNVHNKSFKELYHYKEYCYFSNCPSMHRYIETLSYF